jgi:DnaK suppressor protein
MSFEAVKKKLLKRKLELEVLLKELSQEKVSDDAVQDPGDQALASTLEELKISFQNNEMAEYHKINLALKQIENGTYGTCIDCENPIPERRLEMFPNASRCVGCQEARES